MGSSMDLNSNDRIKGVCAVLGVDIVGFSTRSDDDQLIVVKSLIKWIRAALYFHDVHEDDYRWSPAGDGGYLTFKTPNASEKALDICFSILEKAQRQERIPHADNSIKLRFGLHAGSVYESDELGGGT